MLSIFTLHIATLTILLWRWMRFFSYLVVHGLRLTQIFNILAKRANSYLSENNYKIDLAKISNCWILYRICFLYVSQQLTRLQSIRLLSPFFSWDRTCWLLSMTHHHLDLVLWCVGEWGEYKIPFCNPTASTHRYFVLSPVLLVSRDQDSGPSNSTTYAYNVMEK